jgi:vacuolar-type H+-ATPase subunit E/Vma4
MIHPEKEKIRARILKELEEYKVSMKMYLNNLKFSAQSQKMNKLRLEKLKVKIECVNNVFDEARHHLLTRIKNKPNDYKVVLKNLMIQGFIKLLEENVNIVCKKDDYDIVTGAVDQAKNEFLDLIKRESKTFKNMKLNITVDQKYYLPDTLYIYY